MGVGESSNVRYESAERMLEDFYSRRDNGDAVSFESVVRLRPDLERELRELHALCDEVNGVLLQGQQMFEAEQLQVQRMLSDLTGPGDFTHRYAVEAEVGQGGMGAVLRVRDKKLDRHLAMKVILGQVDVTRSGKTPPIAPRMLARFLNEAKITSQLDHPGIVPVHELGVDAQGRAYFTMKLVRGRTLAEVFDLRAAGASEWPTARVLGFLQRVCEAVAFAHDHGVIHRDLKPLNVMVGDFGEVYVMDWGLARRTAEKPEEIPVPVAEDGQPQRRPGGTREGSVMGTAPYMAPEQAAGKLSELGPRSDVYALGAMLYQLIAGHPPYCEREQDTSDSAIRRRISAGPPSRLDPKLAAPELITICEKAMARDVNLRYRSVIELSDELRAHLEQRVVVSHESGAWAEAKKWIQRNRPLAVSLACAIVILIAGIIATTKFAVDASEQQQIANQKTADVLSLSEIQDLQDLISKADDLWPATGDKVQAYQQWLEDARRMIEGSQGDPALGTKRRTSLAEHKAKLLEIRTRAKPQLGVGTERAVSEPRALKLADVGDRWWEAQLSKLVTGLESLLDPERGLASFGASKDHGWGIRKRAEFASTIQARSMSGPEAAQRWAEAIAAIAESPEYSELSVTPQLGLLPIGPDPVSHLWEFAHLQSGDPAQRSTDGKLRLEESMGIVFVLIPGGTFLRGDQGDNQDERNYDPSSNKDSGPVTQISLSPFFLSKYEMTQGQWKVTAGVEPSFHTASRLRAQGITLLNPVENISWSTCQQHLARLGLELPTEAQWEYATRAGTPWSWWTGPDRQLLESAANLADRYASKHGPESWQYDTALNDGYLVHAPIGSFRANAFGLHDVIGNVWEWCRDPYTGRYPASVGASDGDTHVDPTDDQGMRVLRGGGFDVLPNYARSAHRYPTGTDFRGQSTGVRPARRLEE